MTVTIGREKHRLNNRQNWERSGESSNRLSRASRSRPKTRLLEPPNRTSSRRHVASPMQFPCNNIRIFLKTEIFSPLYNAIRWKCDWIPHWACIKPVVNIMMYYVIVFENLCFVRPQVNEWLVFSKIFTLGSVFKRCDFGSRFHRIRVDDRPNRRKKSPFSIKNGNMWTAAYFHKTRLGLVARVQRPDWRHSVRLSYTSHEPLGTPTRPPWRKVKTL